MKMRIVVTIIYRPLMSKLVRKILRIIQIVIVKCCKAVMVREKVYWNTKIQVSHVIFIDL
jgi:hypothetical protein